MQAVTNPRATWSKAGQPSAKVKGRGRPGMSDRSPSEHRPIYTTRRDGHQCSWQLGGTFIPGTRAAFGGNSTIEYGPITASFYPAPNGIPQYILENFHRTLPFNPCPAGSSDD